MFIYKEVAIIRTVHHTRVSYYKLSNSGSKVPWSAKRDHVNDVVHCGRKEC